MQVTNGFEASYNFVRQSKPIPITDQAFSEFIDSQLIVTIFKGGNRDPAKGDQVIGWFGIELHKLTTDKVRTFERQAISILLAKSAVCS
jgi:hypothetical protein